MVNNKYANTLVIFTLILSFLSQGFANPLSTSDPTTFEQNNFSRYKRVLDFTVKGIIVPKVVIFTSKQNLSDAILLDIKDNTVIPLKINFKSSLNATILSVSSKQEGTPNKLLDNNFNTSFTFDSAQNEHYFEIGFEQIESINGISIQLDNDVIPPKQITIWSDNGDGKYIRITDWTQFKSHTSFPKLSILRIKIGLQSSHLLRISEITADNAIGKAKRDWSELIFYAEEDGQYRLYFDTAFGAQLVSSNEYLPLSTDNKTPIFELSEERKNPLFNDDFDADGIADHDDLCPRTVDPQNIDIDSNGRGDVCEDSDQDRVIGSDDNCPFKYNPDQADKDVDSIGDVCDDTDNRITEQTNDYSIYIVYGVFALFGFLLLAMVFRSLKE